MEERMSKEKHYLAHGPVMELINFGQHLGALHPLTHHLMI
jgi:hypothetical protein